MCSSVAVDTVMNLSPRAETKRQDREIASPGILSKIRSRGICASNPGHSLAIMLLVFMMPSCTMNALNNKGNLVVFVFPLGDSHMSNTSDVSHTLDRLALTCVTNATQGLVLFGLNLLFLLAD